ncbi:MAG: DUF1993 domain-containing protein [Candidatus Magasanikbacteria bacterium]|nr:DUF1993 domain-containing protein [Candidatus Magasanikbacteria bacterium]MCA9390888.1 DUF1993 domain-containing protein [Candidatus Magasanikbacteria bacterium]
MNTYYTFTVPLFTKVLRALDGLLSKAEASGKDEASLLDARLAPDMFPFKKQVQIACDNAKGVSSRLADVENPSHEDNEETFADLHARIAKTLAFISSIPESSFEGAAERQITLPYFPGKYMTGKDYLEQYALANFFFHVTTAYGILRKEGIEIGKADFTGGMPLRDL